MLVFNESTPPLSLKVIQFLLDEKKKIWQKKDMREALD